jgi:hypothetical protein
MVEKMAKLLFPDGKTLGHFDDPEIAFAELSCLLPLGDGVFFEATVIHGNCLARIDILQKNAANLIVTEVKSGSFDVRDDLGTPFRGARGNILSEYKEYLEDLTFQCILLRRAFPSFNIIPRLCLVDKGKKATENSALDRFRLDRIAESGSGPRARVQYLGDVDHLQSEHVLAFLDVTSEISELEPEIADASARLAATLLSKPIQRITSEIGQKCKNCEYRLPQDYGQPNGFRECWGELGNADPHVLDLYRVDLLGGKNRDLVAEMAASGKAQLNDISESCLQGQVAERQRVQLCCTRKNQEWISDELLKILASHPFPLFFIDFEASRLAIPYHVGMHPYEIAAFQWSIHTIRSPDAQVEHTAWLNTDDVFPNFEFARTLKDHLGETGTVYIWSHYELDVLCEIRSQLEQSDISDPQLITWLNGITVSDNPRVVDLCVLARAHYFHPVMKGSLSIKDVLRAAWFQNETIRGTAPFLKYLKHESGRLLDPYAALPPLPIGGKEELVNEGTGAMRVYQEMMFGLGSSDSAVREAYKKLLLQYCELDTAAMVFIWKHWSSHPKD